MPIETSVRTRRSSAAVLALQSARGAPVNDFRLVSGGVRVWSRSVSLSASKAKNQPNWMSDKFADAADSRISVRDNSDGQIIAVATPENLTALLKNSWGPMVGTPKVSALSSVVNQYASLAWIESTALGSVQRLVRLTDLFVYKLRITLRRSDGKLILTGDYAARKNENFDLDNLGSLQFTPAPMTPGDVRVYNVRNATFVRDPAGTPVSLDFIELEITLDQQVNSEWTFSDGWDVWKRGKTGVYVRFVTRLSDEAWGLIDASNAGTLERFRITATTDGTPSTLTIDLFSLDWEFENIGHNQTNGCLVEATGRGFIETQPPESGFVKFTIS